MSFRENLDIVQKGDDVKIDGEVSQLLSQGESPGTHPSLRRKQFCWHLYRGLLYNFLWKVVSLWCFVTADLAESGVPSFKILHIKSSSETGNQYRKKSEQCIYCHHRILSSEQNLRMSHYILRKIHTKQFWPPLKQGFWVKCYVAGREKELVRQQFTSSSLLFFFKYSDATLPLYLSFDMYSDTFR